MTSDTSTAALITHTKTGRRETQVTKIWDVLSFTQAKDDYAISAATGIPRSSVTGRINDLANGKMEGCTLKVVIQKNHLGNMTQHYLRAYNFSYLLDTGVQARFRAARWEDISRADDGHTVTEWKKGDFRAYMIPGGWRITDGREGVFRGHLTCGNFRAIMESIFKIQRE